MEAGEAPEEQMSVIASSSEGDNECPICLCPPSAELRFAKGPCQHEYCVPCVERLLLTKPRQLSHHINSSVQDAHLAAPTWGRCSICRQEMTLFDLRFRDGSLVHGKNTDIAGSALSGFIYDHRCAHVAREPEFESMALSFPVTPGERVTYTGIKAGGESRVKFFDEGCHFHDQSRTFHGRLTWCQEADVGFPESHFADSTDVVLQFSSDWRHIAFGTRVHTPRNDDSRTFPLDGSWWVLAHDGTFSHIQVLSSTFFFGPSFCVIDTADSKQPTFRWSSTTRHFLIKATSGVDLQANPEGPALGERITWTTDEDEELGFVWTRESFARDPDVEILGPAGRLFRLRNAPTVDRTIPIYTGTTLFGNTFCQGLEVGLASYHFLQDGTSYISYEHPDCGRWPPLDDGTPVPARVPFRDAHLNAQERTFHGRIKWLEDQGTSWQGCAEWIYEMRFDTEYTCILAGRVLSRAIDGGDVLQEMSTFGFDLIYINAAINDRFDAMAEERIESPESPPDEENLVMRRYTRVRNALRLRLQQEEASVRTIALLIHVLTASYDPNASNPIDFNL